MANTYILNSVKIAEAIEVSYTNTLLDTIKMPQKHPLSPKQHVALMTHIPMSEELLEFNMGLINVTISKPTGTSQKIALFCEKYMEHKNGLKYKVMPKDTGKIKLIKFDAEILDFYFRSKSFEFAGRDGMGKHSISNLVDYYNLLLQEMASNNKAKYPDHWSDPFESKLKSQQEVNEYWAHLRSLGLEPKKDRLGKTIDWVKKSVM